MSLNIPYFIDSRVILYVYTNYIFYMYILIIYTHVCFPEGCCPTVLLPFRTLSLVVVSRCDTRWSLQIFGLDMVGTTWENLHVLWWKYQFLDGEHLHFLLGKNGEQWTIDGHRWITRINVKFHKCRLAVILVQSEKSLRKSWQTMRLWGHDAHQYVHLYD